MNVCDYSAVWNALQALGTLGALMAAVWAVSSSRFASEGAIFKEFHDEYMGPTMTTALNTLRRWRIAHGDAFADAWWRAMGEQTSARECSRSAELHGPGS
jgi:hypothetical protein